MKKIVTVLFLISSALLFAQQSKPSIVVLGVTHSGQLVNFNQQPAAIRAFIIRVNPAAICIERSPEQFSRNDFYEFTYEQQYCVAPYAREKKIPLYPVDWYPDKNDLVLAFGVSDLEVPSFSRRPSGFWGFTVFSDSSSLYNSLYYADDTTSGAGFKEWYTQYPEKVNYDFARRLFLYRTFLQGKRIERAAMNYKNDTLLVIIGTMHKEDLENHLSADGYVIINPTDFGEITQKEISNNFKTEDAIAICSFNLCGVQSRSKLINYKLLDYAFNKLDKINSGESGFFKIRYKLLKKEITHENAIDEYKSLLENVNEKTMFTWTGVKDKRRLDSYFDPFGNMTLWQRTHLELAREYYLINDFTNYLKEKNIIMAEFNGLKKAMLTDYWSEYIEK
ncbi:MAG TPA: hypothetical protein VKA26_12525 [Ignavibacteriaceae bacterium]|nr:hypothetical protein [Ignavibacteriaceae bacterium]